MKKLNLGCGKQVVDGWVNVDYALGARLAKIPVVGRVVKMLGLFQVDWDERIYLHDLTKRFPWADESVDVVYTSHTIEHLLLEDGKAFISECVRVLKKGGVLRIVVPALAPIVERYRSGELSSEYFLNDLHILYSRYNNGWKAKFAPFVQYPHKCMYDVAPMIRICKELGITMEERKGFDSRIEDIDVLEIGERVVDAVVVEGVKS